MNTPICDFVKAYANTDATRLHMPGHKGRTRLGVESLDITEIDGADVLYAATGIIAESQQNATNLFGSGQTIYSCEGSSLAIRAMLYLALLTRRDAAKRATVLACRNAHKTFLSAVALLDLDVEWVYPEHADCLLSCDVSATRLETMLSAMPVKPIAFYVTSPDYLGHTADIAGLAQVCHRHGVLLLCDNAHGAYLKFLSTSRHPIDLGADMCCDSAHKTLPVLTGGAYLHLNKTVSPVVIENAARAMALFASTSPSYLILQSLDRANAYLADGYREALATCVQRIDILKQALTTHGFTLVGDEPLKLTMATKSYGYTGEELSAYLASHRIVCEFADPDYLVCMFTPDIADESIDRLQTVLLALERRAPIAEMPMIPPIPKRTMTVRQAMFAPSRLVPIDRCEGLVLADPTVSCPPAVPIAVCGERIDTAAIETMRYYGIADCRVVAE